MFAKRKQTNALLNMNTKPDFNKGVRVILAGTTQWAQLTSKSGPNQMAGKYQADLMLDAASVKTLEDLGAYKFVQIKGQDNAPKYEVPAVRIKAMNVPNVFDTHKQKFDDYINNGSTIKANCVVKAYDYKGKKGLSVWVNDVIVLNAVQRDGGSAPADFWEGVTPTEPTFDAPTATTESNDDFPF
jgi:single-stranded DNA-binding protein